MPRGRDLPNGYVDIKRLFLNGSLDALRRPIPTFVTAFGPFASFPTVFYWDRPHLARRGSPQKQGEVREKALEEADHPDWRPTFVLRGLNKLPASW